MNYSNLLEELQQLSPLELQQPVTFRLCDDGGKVDDLIDCSEVESVVCNGSLVEGEDPNKITITV